MRAVLLLFDSLNRHFLPPYGNEWTVAPHFTRLAERSATFERANIGSMPCMPARRELHTGRYNFLHRCWGPLEPFDDSMPQILSENGVYTHLVTDHQHYWEDGGATYHGRYDSFEFVRGQEGDPWKGHADPDFAMAPNLRRSDRDNRWVNDQINRRYLPTTAQQPQPQTFDLGLQFLADNAHADRWFLQIETFDPHEPFFTHDEFKARYPSGDYTPPDDLPHDWPDYKPVDPAAGEDEAYVQYMRYQYAALLSLCDEQLGRLLDAFDAHDLWEDTLLIVTTDHGFLLGEHDWWAKNHMPWYRELANIPFFVWDPRSRVQNERRSALVQMIDVPATLLDYFAVPLPDDMQGQPLAAAVADNAAVREGALFGAHGGHVNVTDGEVVYMRAPGADNAPLYDYTLMTTLMRGYMFREHLQQAELAPPFSFTKGLPVLQVPGRPATTHPMETLLFDLRDDPGQAHPLSDADLETRMIRLLIALMQANDAPSEQYERLGLQE